MSFVDAIHDRKADKIRVVERVDGKRLYKTYPAEYVFYYEDEAGKHKTIFGDPCSKIVTQKGRDFKTKLEDKRARGKRIFESDINLVFRSLAKNYAGKDAPTLNVGFFDIEADFNLARGGFAPPDDPFCAVTAITLYRSQDQKLITLALCPPSLTIEAARVLAKPFDNTLVFEEEGQVLSYFLEAIEDTDVCSGWNSNAYDIPYLVNRITRVLGEQAASKLCLWDEAPRPREMTNKFGKTFNSYDLVGRVHLDYMDLYRKHNTQQQQSYALKSIGESEVGDTKTQYEGTLDHLYKHEFGKFIAYNRQDVLLLVKIDQKKKFIELANQIAHANCVTLKTTMGSVALVEQAIINEMHMMGLIVPNRKERLPEALEASEDDVLDEVADDNDDDDEPEQSAGPVVARRKAVVGAYVVDPLRGLHSEIGVCDINSLYPSAIRALNMSPETVFGQLRPTATNAEIAKRIAKGVKPAEAWEGIFRTHEVGYVLERTEDLIDLDLEDGTTYRTTGCEVHGLVFRPDSNLCLTANGTLFRTDVEGIIPALLAKWYSQRQELQDCKRQWEITRQQATSPEERLIADNNVIFYDQRQLARKILLNSLYGALLNENLRFADPRLGQSTTLTGRSIVQHMNAKINEVILGTYDYRGKALIYGDTDSVVFSAYQALKDHPAYADFDWSRDNIISFYDAITDSVNDSFAGFMDATFHTGLERGAIIKAGRELVGSKGLFIKKKKYAILMYDKEGKRLDTGGQPGKLKAMGLDLKRADTPKVMQKFLESLLMDILTEVPRKDMFEDIKKFRDDFTTRPGWEKGSPKNVSNLSGYQKLDQDAKAVRIDQAVPRGQKLKINMPGHVRGAMNWNTLCDLHDDRYALRITDGTRIILCKLRPNSYKMTSIAYPVDEPHLPDWFKELPFDDAAMENVIIDKKLLNLVAPLNWDLNQTRNRPGDEFFSFATSA